MQDAQNNVISNEYRSVPISILVESATNPRKRFDEKNLEELAASMRAQGILAPLLVRELEESKYEVAPRDHQDRGNHRERGKKVEQN